MKFITFQSSKEEERELINPKQSEGETFHGVGRVRSLPWRKNKNHR